MITTIKTTGLRTYSVRNSGGELIATASKILKKDTDYGKGTYRLCVYGGPAHGKIAYAQDWQDLNDKTVELVQLVK